MTRALTTALDGLGFALGCVCIFCGALLLFIALVLYGAGVTLLHVAVQMREAT